MFNTIRQPPPYARAGFYPVRLSSGFHPGGPKNLTPNVKYPANPSNRMNTQGILSPLLMRHHLQANFAAQDENQGFSVF